MIFGGTFVQTMILAIITIRCDWEKEVINFNKFFKHTILCITINFANINISHIIKKKKLERQ